MPPRESSQPDQPLLELSFLDKGYYENGVLRPELLDTHAKVLGERFAREKDHKVKSTQMRRFYGDVKELETRIERESKGAEIFESNEPQKLAPYLALIRLLKSKAAYAAGRKTVSRAFEDFIAKSVDQIKTPKDFRAFVLFFEAIVGYYYGAGGEKNQ